MESSCRESRDRTKLEEIIGLLLLNPQTTNFLKVSLNPKILASILPSLSLQLVPLLHASSKSGFVAVHLLSYLIKLKTMKPRIQSMVMMALNLNRAREQQNYNRSWNLPLKQSATSEPTIDLRLSSTCLRLRSYTDKKL